MVEEKTPSTREENIPPIKREENTHFGMPRKEDFLDEYRGKYVVFTTPYTSVAGRYNGPQDGYAVLNPYQTISYIPKPPIKVLREKNKKIRLDKIDIVEEITEEEVIAFGNYSDRVEMEREAKEKKKKTEKKEKNLGKLEIESSQ